MDAALVGCFNTFLQQRSFKNNLYTAVLKENIVAPQFILQHLVPVNCTDNLIRKEVPPYLRTCIWTDKYSLSQMKISDKTSFYSFNMRLRRYTKLQLKIDTLDGSASLNSKTPSSEPHAAES